MRNEMKLKVTQDKNKPDEYTVEFDGKCFEKKPCPFIKWLGRRVSKIAILVIVCLCLCFSKKVLENAFCLKSANKASSENPPLDAGKDCLKECEKLGIYTSNTTISGISEILIENEENNDYNNCKDSKNTCATKIACIPNSKLTIKLNSDKPFTITKSINLYQILCMVFIICLTVTLISLITLLIRDDSNIRYEKLDMLNEAKEDLVEILSYKEKDTERKEKHNENSVDKNDKASEKTTSEKSIKAGLVKHYMSCVSEI